MATPFMPKIINIQASRTLPKLSQGTPELAQRLAVPPWSHSWGGQVLSSTALAHKIKPLGTHPRIPRICRIPRKRWQQLLLGPTFHTRWGPG